MSNRTDIFCPTQHVTNVLITIYFLHHENISCIVCHLDRLLLLNNNAWNILHGVNKETDFLSIIGSLPLERTKTFAYNISKLPQEDFHSNNGTFLGTAYFKIWCHAPAVQCNTQQVYTASLCTSCILFFVTRASQFFYLSRKMSYRN